ncbi:MAG: hypothetical protein ABIJ75_07200 [Actinomycetota bacterium]
MPDAPAYEKLAWGLKHGPLLDPDAETLWGARMIFAADRCQAVHDRVDRVGPNAEALTDYLADVKVIDRINEQIVMQRIRPNSTDTFELYSDDRVRVIGSPNGSHGYLYVTAWQHAWWEDIEDPDNGLADDLYEIRGDR